MRLNAFHNVGNPYQGTTKKVLCVCSAGLLRSPTAAVVLSQEPFNYNTRAAGCNEEYALVPVSDLLLHWADEVVCMEEEHLRAIEDRIDGYKTVIVLGIPDSFPYRDPALVDLIKEKYTKAQLSLGEEE